MLDVSWSLIIVASLVVILTLGAAVYLEPQLLRARPRVLTWIPRTSGAVLIGLGLKIESERRA